MRKLLLFFAVFFCTASLSIGQTVLINPAGDGGFENGVTPILNNWTAVNSSIDSWVVGDTPTPSAGSNCAYISTDGGTSWSYSQVSTIQHIYYDVTIPAGESKISLAFDWKAGGEGSGTSDWDNMKVFFGLASEITPVSNTAISSAFQVSGPGAVNGMYKLSSVSWNSETINLSGTPGSTYRLVFSWKSDITDIANPPAAIDEVSLVSSTPVSLVGGTIYPINNVSNAPVEFANITEAVNYMNSEGITGVGQVIFELGSSYNSATEPGPISIPTIAGASSTLGVTFRPGTGVTALTSIAGLVSPNQFAILISGSYITLDGRAGGTGSGRDWTIRVTGTTNAQSAVRLSNPAPVTGLSIRNLILEASATGTTAAILQIGTSSTAANTMSDIVIENNLIGSETTTTIRGYGITTGSASSSVSNTGLIIRNNEITRFSTRGINLTAGFPGQEIHGNRIYHSEAHAGGTAEFTGIYFSTTSAQGTKIYDNFIYDIQITSITTGTNGIYLFNGNTSGDPILVYNNVVVLGDKVTGTANTTTMHGIRENSTAGGLINIYYNSVAILGEVSSGANNTAAFRKQSSNFLNVHNNIFYSERFNSGSATGTHWAIMINNTSIPSIGNNNYWSSGVGGVLGTTTGLVAGNQATLAAWKTAVSGDVSSVSQNPNYVNVFANPPNLNINTALPTQLESGGVTIAGIDTDFEGTPRFPNVGYPEKPGFPPFAPDIGAFEFGGEPIDLIPPTIAFTPLGNTSSTVNRTLTATISDGSGVPTLGNGLPVLYWSINSISGPFTDATGSYIAGDDYQFNFGAGVAVGDVVYYYIVAQDEATPPNVGANPSGGAGGFTINPPAASTPPTTPESYLVTDTPLSGDYTVGLGMFNRVTGKNITFEKRTRIIEEIVTLNEYHLNPEKWEINSPEVRVTSTGNAITEQVSDQGIPTDVEVTVSYEQEYFVPFANGVEYTEPLVHYYNNLTDGTRGVYATINDAINDANLRGISGPVRFLLTDATYPSETFPIVLPAVTGMSAINTISIMPDTDVTTLISTGINNALFIFDNVSNYVIDGRQNGVSNPGSLTITNTNNSAAGHVISLINGATNNTIQYAQLSNNGALTAGNALILFSTSASNPSGNSNNLIESCNLSGARSGINFSGTAANPNVGNTINNCNISDFGFAGIWINTNSNDATIKGNLFTTTSVGVNVANSGINIGTSAGGINEISDNRFIDIQSTATTSIRGINLTAAAGSVWNVFNNEFVNTVDNGTKTSIYFVQSSGALDYTLNLYYNSFFMSGTHTSTAANILSCGYVQSNTHTSFVLNAKNNVVHTNRSGGTGPHVGAFYGNVAGVLDINYNIYFANGISNSFPAGYSGFVYTDITAYKTATTPHEANSDFANPLFVSSTDLRPFTTSPLISAGTPIVGITTDILGDPRSGTTPTIGAYEEGVAPPSVDVGISSIANPVAGQIVNANGSDINAYVMNFGSVIVSDVDVYYDLNGGTPVGPVVVAGPINPGDSALVTFTGANQLTSMTDLTGTLNVYTDYPGDGNAGNDALSVSNVFLRVPPSSFPYFSDFSESPSPYTLSGSSNLWGLFLTTNPSGTPSDAAARANFYGVSSGSQILRSTLVDLTGTTNPLLSFYRAYTTYTTPESDDALQVVVSTNGGLTWSAPLYSRSWFTVPSLGTLPAQGTSFAPSAAGQWMHNLVDLSAYAGQEIVVGFNAITAWGNNLWIDNIKVSDPDNISLIPVNAPGTYGSLATNGIQIAFTALRPGLGNGVITQTDNQGLWTPENVVFGHLSEATEEREQTTKDGSMLSRNTSPVSPDASEGVLALSRVDEFPVNNVYQSNISATTFSGAIFTPDVVADRYWEVAFTGDDYVSTATYDVILDISTQLGIVNPDRLYIMKRVDQNSPWVCLNTITEYELGVAVRLIATGLQGFSQFGIGTDDGTLPVDLVEFNATVDRNNVTLNWTTAWEENNMRFDVQRRIAETDATWATIGSVTGNGTTQEQKSYSYLDRNLVTGMYEYRLVQVDFDGNSTADHTLSSQVEVGIPTEFALSQNYPNPFNPTTKIDFQIPVEGFVKLSVYDMSGREVATLVNEALTPGYYTYTFNGANFASGVYFYRLVSSNSVMTKRAVLVK